MTVSSAAILRQPAGSPPAIHAAGTARAGMSVMLAAFFVLMWLKLGMAGFLREEAGFLLSKLVDLAFVLPLLLYLAFNVDYYLERCAVVLLGFLLVAASAVATELTAQRSLFMAIFDTLKFLTPFLFLMVLHKFYRERPVQVITGIRWTLLLVVALALAGLALLEKEVNRGQLYEPAYFAGLHTSAYMLLLSAVTAFYLSRCGDLNWYASAAIMLLASWLVMFAWGVRTAMAGVAAFVVTYVLLLGWRARAAVAYLLLLVLTLLFAALVAGFVDVPAWNDLVEISSGRLSMWEYKLRLFMDSTLTQAFFGKGAGSDLVVSEIWWWGKKDSHNDFLRQLSEHGIVGLGAVVFFLVAIMRMLARGSRFVLPVFAIYVVSSLFSNGVMYRPLAGLLFALALIASLRGARPAAGAA